MSATPYELRAQLLKQAEGILMMRHQNAFEKTRESMHINLQRNPDYDHAAVEYPEMPTTEDIIVEAEKLYRFVQTK
mgnify:CR=1 FL=1